jgi:NMD protein affecting ribosome stability and mRNA decay
MADMITTYCRRCGKEQIHEVYISSGGYLHSLCTECGKDVSSDAKVNRTTSNMSRYCGNEDATRYHIRYISNGGYIHWFCCSCGKDISSDAKVE